ncbi:MAG: glycosyltransferase [Candidatus Nanoarchaeia archaeon]
MGISLCMIAKDEEQYIRECLQSAKDHVDEIILVDTGSSDRTVAIAESFGVKIFKGPDVKEVGFAAARNESLKHATQDWILVLDADEVISEKDWSRVKELVKGDFGGFLIDQRNYTDDNTLSGWVPNDEYGECRASGYHVSKIVRLFKRGYGFENRVHEEVDQSILKSGGKIGNSGIPVHHYGLLKGNIEEKRDKYLELGLEQIKTGKNPLKARYEIARIYRARKQYKEAIKHLEEVGSKNPAYRQTLSNLADCYYRTGDKDKAISTYKKSIKANPKNENAYINFGVMLIDLEHVRQAAEVLKLAVRVAPKSPTAYHNLIAALVKAKQPGEAFKYCLAAIKITGMEKFSDTASVLKKSLGKEADVYEAMQEKDFEKAALRQKELIEEQPTWYGYYLNLSSIYLQAKQKDNAIQALQDGLAAVDEGQDILQKRLDKVIKL